MPRDPHSLAMEMAEVFPNDGRICMQEAPFIRIRRRGDLPMRLAHLLPFLALPALAQAPATDGIRVNTNANNKTITCHNEPLTVSGNSNNLKIMGDCTDVRVNGNSNNIHVFQAKHLTVSGNDNSVVFPGPSTRISDTGRANNIATME
jgi:hypothetical protein